MEKIDQNKVPKRKFYTGEEIPAVGLGTFGSDKYGPEAISEAVYGAIKFGYRSSTAPPFIRTRPRSARC